MHRVLSRIGIAPAFAAVSLLGTTNRGKHPSTLSLCEEEDASKKKTPAFSPNNAPEATFSTTSPEENEDGSFHGHFPMRQLWKPKEEYPLWNKDWDTRASMYEDSANTGGKPGVTRHIILIRHGQYDETHKEDEKRILTKFGREQAELTGKRLAELIKGVDETAFEPCNVKVLRVSDMARAKETADIIASYLPDVQRANPDALLNEGFPANTIPGRTSTPSIISKVDKGHPRIEEAFCKYFYRWLPDTADEETDALEANPQENIVEGDVEVKKAHPRHEFEIIVCHGNVIRYFFCRALQMPPEAWLRLCTFNCSLTYFTIRPTGSVSCRMLGDIGHLGYDHSSFSMHHGFNW